MLIFKKEKAVRKLALEHTTVTHNCLKSTRHCFTAYLSDTRAAFEHSAAQVSQLESEADTLKRKAREVLQSGAYLPHIRSDVYRLIEAVDRVAGAAEQLARFLGGQSPAIPKSLQNDYLAIIDLTVHCSGAMRKALHAFFKPKGVIQTLDDNITRVNHLESEIDDRQMDLMQRVFRSELPLADKMHLGQLIDVLGSISNAAEHVTDELKYAALKSVV
jgi:predicted phosphate transport protein (TIGR00153 family)